METTHANEIMQSVVAGYDTIAQHFAQTRQAPWLEFNDLKPLLISPCRLLDVGCANGRLLPWLQQNCQTLNYTGVDNSAGLLAIARSQFPQHEFITASMLQLPLPDAQFDIVACVAALQHIPSVAYRTQALTELRRVTKPGGTLFMLNWDIYQSKFSVELTTPPAECDAGDIFVPWKNDQGEILAQRYYHAFSVAELTELCTKTGWQVITCAPSAGGHNLVTIAKPA